MLRGINRNIIEINDTENQYFDKVILFVNPEFSRDDISRLNKEGRRFIDSADLLKISRRNRSKKIVYIRNFLFLFAAVAAGAVFTLIFF